MAISVGRATSSLYPSQIGTDREPLGKSRRYFVPGNVGPGHPRRRSTGIPSPGETTGDALLRWCELGLHKAGASTRYPSAVLEAVRQR